MARKKRAGTVQSSTAAKPEEAEAKQEAPIEPSALEPDPSLDPALISSAGVVATKCYASVSDFTRGTRWERFQASTGEAHNCVPSADLPTCCLALRSKAKKALLSLAQEFPGSPLPNRYLVIF